MSKKSALLLGASGLVGGHCLDYLLSDGYYSQVHVWGRRPLPIEHPRLVQHQVNFDQLKDQHPDVDADDVFCCLGTTIKKAGSQDAFYEVDFTYTTEIAKLSFAGGAEQFLIVSALGADPGSSIFYNRVKGEVEQTITQIGFQGFHIFQPSLLLGERQEKRFAEEIGQKIFKWLSFAFRGRLRKYRAIQGQAVAAAMVKIARENRSGKQIFESHQIQTISDQH